jgi:hypothetical protein
MGWVLLKCGNGVPLADLSHISTAEVMRPSYVKPVSLFFTRCQVSQIDTVVLVEHDPSYGFIDEYMPRSCSEALTVKIAVVVPSFCRSKKGTEMTVTGSLNTLVIRTSICNHPLASTVKLDLAVVMPNPISLWMSNAAARA